MPIHDWSRIFSGIFHHFHQHWSIEIAATLNRGILPKRLSAMVEQRAGPKEPDDLAVESRRSARNPVLTDAGGLLTVEPPATSIVRKTDANLQDIQELKKLKNLYLEGPGARITRTGIAELRSALPECTIKASER